MSDSPSIEFVYFDLGNILLSFDADVACRNLSSVSGVPVDRVRELVYDSGLEVRFEHGHCSPEEFAGELRQGLELELSQGLGQIEAAEILDAISDMFSPIEKMIGIPKAVQDNGFPIGVLSNTCHAHWDWIARQKYPVMNFIADATVLSYEAHSMKPDSVIYEIAEQKAGVAVDRILFLDDKEENTAAARRRGWNAVTCMGDGDAVDVLDSYGLLGGMN